MTRDEQIDRLATELCEVCRSRHKCNTEGKCTMVYIVAEGLYEVDYRKQIKAEWKTNSEKFSNIYDHFYCSNCNNYTDERNPYRLGKYCSYCGAKMITKGD